MRTVTLIAAPTSAGAYAPGQENGPRALLDAGLREELEAVGVTVRIGGQVSPFRWRPDPENRRAANAGAVTDRASQVASLVRSAPAGDTILVLGGDCTVGVGTVAGLLDRSGRLGLVYVDRHADLNVPGSTVDGALDWMGVAHMLDIDGAVDELAALAGQRPILSATLTCHRHGRRRSPHAQRTSDSGLWDPGRGAVIPRQPPAAIGHPSCDACRLAWQHR
jgi:arginase